MVAVLQAVVQLRARGAGLLDNEQQSILQLEAQEPASEAAASLSADQGQTVVPLLSDVANHAPSIDHQSFVPHYMRPNFFKPIHRRSYRLITPGDA